MKKRVVQQRIFRSLILSLTILLIGGGVALLCQWRQGPVPGHASSDSVIGPPSLPATTVETILRRVGSPMVGTGQAIEAAARAANIDDAFALAVWWTETNDGEAGVGRADRNPGSVRGSIGYPSAYDGYTIYPSYTAAVNYWFPMLKRNYISRGLTTVSAIAHPYVGTSTSYLWAGKVAALMNRYRGEAPPPTATPRQVPTPPASLQRVQQSLARKQREQATGSIPATVAPASTPQREQTTAFLPGATTTLLLLVALIVALASGLQAWRLRKRSAGRPASQPFAQSTEHLWADLRASHQQPAVFFSQHSLGGLLPVTDDLLLSMPNTGTLGMTNPAHPQRPSISQVFPTGGLSPYSFRATPSYTGQFLFGAPGDELAEQLPFDAPVTSCVSQPSIPGDLRQISCQDLRPPVSPPAFAAVPGGLRRNRLQPTISKPVSQRLIQPLQPVGAYSSGERPGGLLSRYREMQTRQEA